MAPPPSHPSPQRAQQGPAPRRERTDQGSPAPQQAPSAAIRGVLRRRLGCKDIRSVPAVRAFIRELLRDWQEIEDLHGLGDGSPRPDPRQLAAQRADTVGSAELLASELVTNALIHTEHGAVVTVTVVSSVLRVEVRDFMPGLPLHDPPHPGTRMLHPEGRDTVEPPSVDDLSTHGRGLLLVRELADSWGVRTQRAGKVIWFELRKRPA
ncbi:ATP-binding protein [Streptomyces sp. NPDC059076]|uniref:ATP-binding protein n=1 Tax=unclassified Streptomyces TaxID=2593676 RepID=UPI0036A506AE